MAGPEKLETNRFVSDLHEYCEEFGVECFTHKLHGSAFSVGLPDLLVIVDGLTWFIEMKMKGNKPTAKQIAVMRRMAKAGCLVGLCTIEVLNDGRRVMQFDVMRHDGSFGGYIELTRPRGHKWNFDFLMRESTIDNVLCAKGGIN